jgi:citrate synthase
MSVTYAKGLEGVIATDSKVCWIDGAAGELRYRGYAIQDLAENSTFGESAYLLLRGKLPTTAELAGFEQQINDRRAIDPSILGVLSALPKDAHPMIALQTALAAHGAINPVPAGYTEANFERAIELIARIPTMVAAFHRISLGLPVLAPRPDLGHGQNFLYMVTGDVPDEETGKIFDVGLILHMEHDLNASTFAARVVASTLAPMDASVSAGVGALYGPLHGGANEAVLDQLESISSVEATEQWVMDSLTNKTKIMGMGHRVYRAKDPRSFVFEGYLSRIAEKYGENDNFRKLKTIEGTMRREMEKKGKDIYPNVDFFSGTLYQLLGIPTSMFTPIFAIARMVGWTAHVLEQWEDNRLYRPNSDYTGDKDVKWVGFDQR